MKKSSQFKLRFKTITVLAIIAGHYGTGVESYCGYLVIFRGRDCSNLVFSFHSCKNKEYMNMTPKYNTILIIGAILFVASPFLFFLIPNLIEPYICHAYDPQLFACANKSIVIGLISAGSAFIVGLGLMLWVLIPQNGNNNRN